MAEILRCSVISFFAICGFVSVGLYLCQLLGDMKVMKGKTVFTVVAVKNEEERIEGIARNLILKSVCSDSGLSDNRIIIVDEGSDDNTAEIAQRLEKDGKGVQLLTPDMLTKSISESVNGIG